MALPAISTYSPPGPYSGYIPGYDPSANARLLVEYARNPKKFQLNQYITIQPVTKAKGLYPKFLPSDQIRLPFADGSDKLWSDGTPSGATTNFPQGQRFTNLSYEAMRYKEEGHIGWITRDQSDFDWIKIEQNRLASIMMTLRTVIALTAAVLSTNYPTNHVSTASAFSGGGFWSSGTINSPYIKVALDNIKDRILLDSNALVEATDLRLVIAPTLASTMSRAQEIRAYLSNQSNALAVLQGSDPKAGTDWSLPNPLYGFVPIIERSPKVTTKPSDLAGDGTDGTAVYCMDTNTALVVARPGGLVSESGGMSYSTVHLVELKGNAFRVFVQDLGELHKLVYIRVEDFFTVIVPAPETGFVVTNCVS